MTEKRFKIIDKQFISYYGGYGHLISNGNCKFWLWHDESGSQKVCDKLNIIMEENEQLKEIKERYDETIVDWNALKSKYDDLNNENEQLKERIKTLEREVQELSCGEADWLIEEML